MMPAQTAASLINMTSLHPSGQENQKQLERYLSCPSNGIMDVLHTFPQIKKLSLKVNTSLPASAACETLQS